MRANKVDINTLPYMVPSPQLHGEKLAHIGFIMDGNRTWAKRQGLNSADAYRRGSEICEEVLRETFELGISVASFYVLSRQNLENRPPEEVRTILEVFLQRLKQLSGAFCSHYQCAIKILGDTSVLPAEARKVIDYAELSTAHFSKHVAVFCVNFDGRDEIIRFIRNFPEVDLMTLTTQSPSGLPDIDIIIRTGGGNRLSNFMIWEANYAELVTVDELWPDFKASSIQGILGRMESLTKYGS